MTDNKKPI